MGREIRRVVAGFDAPLDKPWKGFLNPYRSTECTACERGYNPATQHLEDTFHLWSKSLTQDEVGALVAEDRLRDLTHTRVPGVGWTPKDPPSMPTPEEVANWASKGLGHDGCNRHILVQARATRLGVYGLCSSCHGSAEIWPDAETERKHESWWEDERQGPPAGDWWQLWETVSEGSPITPAFATPEELIDWMCLPDKRVRSYSAYPIEEYPDLPWAQGWRRHVAEPFVKKEGQAVSMMVVNGQWMSGAEGQYALQGEEEEEEDDQEDDRLA